MARPVLGVDRVVLDRGVEPEPVALLAVIERALEGLPRPGPPAATAAPSPAAPAWRALVLVAVLLGLVGLRLQGRRHKGVVLRSEVLLEALAVAAVAVCAGLTGLRRGREIVLPLEVHELPDAHIELMSDPGVGPPLPNPGPNLV